MPSPLHSLLPLSVPTARDRVLTLRGAALEQDGLPPLEAIRIDGTEGINTLFEYRLQVQTPELPPGIAPWSVDARRLLGREITIDIELDGAGTFVPGAIGYAGQAGAGAGIRQISGVICELRRLDADSRHLRLELVLRPGFWQATLSAHHHAFHDMTVVEVLQAVLAHHPWPVDRHLVETYPCLDRITQWGETDWNFCCRLMQQNGINHHFEHTGSTHRLVLSDHNGAFRPFGDEGGPYRQIPMHAESGRIDREFIHQFTPCQRITSLSWEARDYDYTQPRLELVARGGQASSDVSHGRHEIYQWRAAGAHGCSDGLSGALWSQPNAGRDPQANTHAATHARWLARIRLEERSQHATRAEGAGHIRGIVAGRSFHLQKHRQAEANVEHLVLHAELHLQAPGQESQSSTAAGHWLIDTRFLTQPASQPLRPPLTLSKPRVAGCEVGIVTGPLAGQVHTDALGRIKVWQPWQRSDRQDADASPWLRVAHPWAGNQQGAAFLPRVGQEVLVSYYGGDPDLPIVTGSVHNALNQPGWQLPGQHVLTGIRSRELGESGGNTAPGRSNHMLLDDSPGHIQAQLKSDHQHSSLSLGDIHRIDNHEGRREARGQGAELRTDGHGVVRAALGLILSTQARTGARGGVKEIAEALQRLSDAQDRHGQLADASQTHQVQDANDQRATQQKLKQQSEELRGTGEALGELGAPHLLIDSAAGIHTAAAASTQQASGEHHAIVSGEHTSIAAGGSLLASAAQAIRLFARAAGMRLFAAEQNIEMQAQRGSVEVRAKDTIRLQARVIELQAEQYVLINGAGSHSRWEAQGTTHGTPGRWRVHAAASSQTGPASLPVTPAQFPSSVCKECLAAAARERAGLAPL
ncbi:type VI secretion system Vgr family protein [Xylophilus sp. GOD-11R]|uniref:type VI secretion system Vgr family protein n=1 Tax=Xylophilus sp. GOD-11R TaxID=3089814 RepID=UPI00298C7502|nr:type VI secretion system tip protein TssI/VgrG [Xylophilus sp. GOD-11R]WPB55362.1 type VI secretion system tip protein TssI/VgrG [Xylophilus sp. GOD-11R]